MTDLHVYRCDSTCDWFVAESLEAAIEAWHEYHDDLDQVDPIHPSCKPLADESLLELAQCEDDYFVEKTCAEWAVSNGTGFLARDL